MQLIRPLGVLAAAVLLFGCGSTASTSSQTASTSASPGAGQAVQIKNYSFAPAELTVATGTKVTWTNSDSASHTATASDGSFDTGTLKDGAKASVTLSDPGTFTYYCQFHPFMKARIVVEG